MRKLFLAAALLLASPALAQQGNKNSSPYVEPLGYCQLTSVSVATAFSSCSGGVPANSAWAKIISESAAWRWRDDGVAPTATVGFPENANAPFYYSGSFANLQVIPQNGSTTFDIVFYAGAPPL